MPRAMRALARLFPMVQPSFVLAAVLGTAALSPAQLSASYTLFALGCVGTSGMPTNTINGLPRIGQTSTITFGNVPPPGIVFGFLGLSNTVSAFGLLPIDLGVLGATGCMLRVSPDVSLALPAVAGSASMTFSIANDPLLLGFTFHTQAMVIAPLANPFGALTSAAATAVVGL
jgi:hypothetical protein